MCQDLQTARDRKKSQISTVTLEGPPSSFPFQLLSFSLRRHIVTLEAKGLGRGGKEARYVLLLGCLFWKRISRAEVRNVLGIWDKLPTTKFLNEKAH